MSPTLIFLLVFLTTSDHQVTSSKIDASKCTYSKSTDANHLIPITVADCSGLNLDQVPQQIGPDVTVLDLSHNQIVHVTYNNSQLTTLILSYNQLAEIVDGSLQLVPNLERLSLDHNKLEVLPELTFTKLTNLHYLDLSFNQLSTIPNNIFGPLVGLQSLDLSFNDKALSQVFNVNHPLQQLALSVNVTSLKLNRIGLTQIDAEFFANYTNIKRLEVAYNELEAIPSVPYTVEYLDVSGSSLKTVQAKHLNYHSLKTLKMDRLRNLESIHKYAFYNVPKLEELSLEDSGLKEFNELVFGLLSKHTGSTLKKINLSKNQLEFLNYTYKYLFEDLELVDLRNNNWKCDCNMLWLKELDDRNGYTDITCITPRSLHGKKISELQDEDLPSCHPEKYGKPTHRLLIPILIILVLVLTAVVAYLIYYAPNWNGNSSRIGPGSPYNIARTDENN